MPPHPLPPPKHAPPQADASRLDEQVREKQEEMTDYDNKARGVQECLEYRATRERQDKMAAQVSAAEDKMAAQVGAAVCGGKACMAAHRNQCACRGRPTHPLPWAAGCAQCSWRSCGAWTTKGSARRRRAATGSWRQRSTACSARWVAGRGAGMGLARHAGPHLQGATSPRQPSPAPEIHPRAAPAGPITPPRRVLQWTPKTA